MVRVSAALDRGSRLRSTRTDDQRAAWPTIALSVSASSIAWAYQPQKTAENGLCFTVSLPRGETDETSLPEDVAVGLERLATIRPPRITRPEPWSAVAADAVRLAADGWAAQALRLGWHPLELWGCSPDRGGNPDHEGLAIWLDGRRVLLVDDATCIVESGPDARSVAAGGVLLWNLGRVS